MDYKRILTVQDISCVGQCSATVALPVLSVSGFETSVLPCSLLSNHTTGFDSYSFMDLSGEMDKICRQWQRQNIKFSALYSGYIGSVSQLERLKKVMTTCLEPDAVKIIDPAMADNGRLYPGFDRQFVSSVRQILPMADYLLPNITEACLLTDTPYPENYDKSFVDALLEKLYSTGCKNIVITGVCLGPGQIGVAVCHNGNISYYSHEKMPFSSPGTGDVFASVFTGAVLKGHTVYDSAVKASEFVVACLKETAKYPQHRYGPVFEPLLHTLPELFAK